MKWAWQSFDQLTLQELYRLMTLRQEVFVVEQNCAYLDADGLDPAAHHLIAWEEDLPVAALRAFPAGVHPAVPAGHLSLGRVVTAPSHRGTGLGRELMVRGLEAMDQTWGTETPIHISAQAHLQKFYESLGFRRTEKAPYLEDDIPHVAMVRKV